jgi:hypothetical protein
MAPRLQSRSSKTGSDGQSGTSFFPFFGSPDIDLSGNQERLLVVKDKG